MRKIRINTPKIFGGKGGAPALRGNLFIVLTAVLLILVACGAGGSSTSAEAASAGNSGSNAQKKSGESVPSISAGPVRLDIGLMPAVDTAPMFHAQDAGYFDDEGIDVEFTLFTNAQDRQSALQTGQIDGSMTDLVAVTVNAAGGFKLYATMLTDGMFPVLIRPGASEQERVKIGLMEVSVTNFLADNWLASDYILEKTYINAIPARLEALASGQLDMGVFPEPIASVGASRGLEKLIFDAVDGFSPDVMVFTKAAISAKEEAIFAFHRGYARAVEDISADPSLARDAIMKHIPNLPDAVRLLMTLPEYHEPRLPDDEYLEKIIQWTGNVSGDSLSVGPEDLVDTRFVDN